MVLEYEASVEGGPGRDHFRSSRRGANVGGVFRRRFIGSKSYVGH